MSRARKRALVIGAAATVLLSSASAAAEDVVAAEALFNRGVTEMAAGHYDRACPAIAESLRIDPQAGTLFTLAECEAKLGRIATAATHYREYMAMFARMPANEQRRHRKRETITRAQLAALEPDVPVLTISLPVGAPRGTRVTRDGVTISEAALGVPLSIDPGEHVVAAQAPGVPQRELKVTIARGEKKTVVVEVHEDAPPPPGAPPPAPIESGPSKQRIAAYVTGGVGIAALVIGGVAGGLTMAKKATIQADCGVGGVKTDCRTQEGVDAAASARTTGLVSTIGFGAGIAGVGTALVLWLTEPSKEKRAALERERPWVRPAVLAIGYAGAVVGLRGAF